MMKSCSYVPVLFALLTSSISGAKASPEHNNSNLRGDNKNTVVSKQQPRRPRQSQSRRREQDTSTIPVLEKNSEDGGISSRIVGGYHAVHTPWFALTLQNDPNGGGHTRGPCGAAMISRRWAVTAGHCVSNYFEDDLRSRLNALYVGSIQPWHKNDEGEKNNGLPYDVINVTRIVEHPDHEPGPASRHDIALIELERDVSPSFTDFRPIELASPDLEHILQEGDVGTVYGFGQTSFGGPLAQQLLAVDVGYVPREPCASMMDKWTISDDMACFGGDGIRDR